MMVSLLISVSMLVLSVTASPARATDCLLEAADEYDEVAIARFTKVVNKYVELHRLVENPMSPRTMSSDPEQIARASDRLAAAIREARPTAGPGRLFTPQVADFFRRRIATAVRDVECDVANWLDEMEEASLPGVSSPVANGSFPWGFGDVAWPSVLWRLPLLPEELEYRFAGRDIVILDVHANLVVDVLENAAPQTGEASGLPSTAPSTGPCDAHPELAACWT
jgi:hypothetical protein